MRAWLVTAPHPSPEKRRWITRRTPAGLRILVRVPVRRVEVIEQLPRLRLARVRFACGAFPVDTWVSFDRLASDRERFRARLASIATVFPEPAAA